MEPKAKPAPGQPNPADPNLPAKGTSDPQGADAQVTNLPRPDSTPDAPPTPAAAPLAAEAEPTPESAVSAEASPADPAAADIRPDPHGDTDPGASRNDDAQPL